MKKLVIDYLKTLQKTLGLLNEENIVKLAELFVDAYLDNKQIFVFGNGGSAATASHLACDINKGVSYGRKKRFKVFCLNDNLATIMAYSNDLAYSEIFVEQLKNFIGSGDLVIGFSGSGKSANVINAIKYANANNAITFGISGFDGGKLAKLAHESIVVTSNDMQKIEDVHMIIVHILMQSISQQIDRLAKKVVVLDRDGVINKKMPPGDYVKTWQEFVFLPEAKKAIKIIRQKGYLVFVVTNQRGIGRGIFTSEALSEIHNKMRTELLSAGAKINRIYYCPHDHSDNCHCRKPKTGLLQQLRADFPFIDFSKAYFIGDSDTDILAGKKMGMKTVLISTGKTNVSSNYQASCLLDAAKHIL